MGGICFLMVVFICLGETIGYILWYLRAKKEVLKGRLPSARGMGIVRRILFGMLSFMMILWTLRTLFGGGLMERWLVVLGVACFSLLFGIVYAGMGWMKKKGPVRERTSDRRNDRRIFYFVFYAGISYLGNFEGV